MKSFDSHNKTDAVLSLTEYHHRGDFLEELVDACCQIHGTFQFLGFAKV